ncbi:MAG: hypothetical protein GY753_11885 [Gammaproteobacteria bacterium]|nr:hypothetical protein [Gammaproteobacteria bacterium]
MTEFCTCTKQIRRLYADKCLNCDKPIEGIANVQSNAAQPAITMVLHGRRIDLVGNKALIMDVDDTCIEHQLIGTCASDTMKKVYDWLHTVGAYPVPTEAARLKVAAEEILGILKRRQVKAGPAYWNILTHVQMDFAARKMDGFLFMPALFNLWGDSRVEFKDGLNRLRIKPGESHA